MYFIGRSIRLFCYEYFRTSDCIVNLRSRLEINAKHANRGITKQISYLHKETRQWCNLVYIICSDLCSIDERGCFSMVN